MSYDRDNIGEIDEKRDFDSKRNKAHIKSLSKITSKSIYIFIKAFLSKKKINKHSQYLHYL